MRELHEQEFGYLLWPTADTPLKLFAQIAAPNAAGGLGDDPALMAAEVISRCQQAWSRAWPADPRLYPNDVACWGRANQGHDQRCWCSRSECEQRLSDRTVSVIDRFAEVVRSTTAWFDDVAVARRYVLAMSGVAVTITARASHAGSGGQMPPSVVAAAREWYDTYLP